jgi:hypothetical protein
LRPDGAHVEVRLARLDLTLARLDPWSDATTGAYVQERVTLLDCPPAAPPTTRADREGWIVVAWDVRCAAPPTAIVSRLFATEAPSHLHFVRRRTTAGALEERILTAAAPRWPLGHEHGASIGDYVALGIEHIASGWDHVAFVLTFLLLAGSLGEVAAVVTAFTVAHTATLGLATIGLVRPDPAAVEALIGFSIALVALEGAWILGGRGRVLPVLAAGGLAGVTAVGSPVLGTGTLLGLALFTACQWGLLASVARPHRVRALIAFGFGLIHGFGFAGVLAEMRLPRGHVLPALLGFNVGVEVGQLAIVAAGWLVLTGLARRAPALRRLVAEAGSAALCGLGLYWFVVRGWG